MIKTASHPRAPRNDSSARLRQSTGSRNSITSPSSATTISGELKCWTSWLRKYASDAHIVAATATRMTENRSTPSRLGAALAGEFGLFTLAIESNQPHTTPIASLREHFVFGDPRFKRDLSV